MVKLRQSRLNAVPTKFQNVSYKTHDISIEDVYDRSNTFVTHGT